MVVKTSEVDPWQRFSESVRSVIFRGNTVELNLTSGNALTEVMVADVIVLHAAMESGVLADAAVIVTKER